MAEMSIRRNASVPIASSPSAWQTSERPSRGPASARPPRHWPKQLCLSEALHDTRPLTWAMGSCSGRNDASSSAGEAGRQLSHRQDAADGVNRRPASIEVAAARASPRAGCFCLFRAPPRATSSCGHVAGKADARGDAGGRCTPPPRVLFYCATLFRWFPAALGAGYA